MPRGKRRAKPDPAPTGDVDALVARLTQEAAETPRWDCEDVSPYTVAEAVAAVAAVANAKEWLFYCWLVEAGDHGPGPGRRSVARREAVASALDFIVALSRTATPGERQRRVRAAEESARRFEATWPGLRGRIRDVLALAERGGTATDDDVVAALLGAPRAP